MRVPGVIYSLLLAAAAWAITYFSVGGAGGAYLFAPLAIAAVPIILKLFTVQTPPAPTAPASVARGFAPLPEPSKTRRFLLG